MISIDILFLTPPEVPNIISGSGQIQCLMFKSAPNGKEVTRAHAHIAEKKAPCGDPFVNWTLDSERKPSLGEIALNLFTWQHTEGIGGSCF